MAKTNASEPKVWGWTEVIVRHPVFSVHHIEVMPGAFCSVHRHTHRVNLFYVLRGNIVVRIWDAADRPRDVLLAEGERCEVPPNMFHQFSCKTRGGADVLEIYYPVLPTDEDIERRAEGGVDQLP